MATLTQRIVDANLNRLAEGLRVLEDVARLALDDAALTARLKGLRHELIEGSGESQKPLLAAREAESDVGAELESGAGTKREDLPDIAIANARRSQEALRVLEEFARLPDQSGLQDSATYARARFSLYEIEKQLLSRLWRLEKKTLISGLYVIIDTDALKGRCAIDVARQAISGGASVLQLRDKITPKGTLEKTALELHALCKAYDVLFLVNDHLDIALASGADGIHLGQKDLPVSTARRLLSIDSIIGCSTKTVAQALQAQADGADYLAMGAIYPTTTKVETILVGIERLKEIKAAASLPVVAIGGINRANAAEVARAGADCIAVITAVLAADDVEQATRELVTIFEQTRKETAGRKT